MKWWFSPSRRRFRRAASTSRRRLPALEALERRLALSVNAARVPGGTLKITMDAPGDVANIGDGDQRQSVTVNDVSYDVVKKIEIIAEGFAGQTVNLNGSVQVSDGLIAKGVSAVNLNGSYSTGRVIIELSDKPGGIQGNGKFSAGKATFNAGNNDITLAGPNRFQGDVVIEQARNVTLTDADSALRLKRMLIDGSAVLTSRSLRTTGNPDDYLNGVDNSLTLRTISPKAEITVGSASGPNNADYTLSRETMRELGKFHNLTIGREDGQHDILVRPSVMTGNVTIRTPKGGSINAFGGIQTSGEGSVTLSSPVGGTRLGGSVTIDIGGFTVVGPLTLNKPWPILISTAGNINLEGPINDDDAPNILELDAPGCVITLGEVGNLVPLRGLRILRARDVVFKGIIRAGFVER